MFQTFVWIVTEGIAEVPPWKEECFVISSPTSKWKCLIPGYAAQNKFLRNLGWISRRDLLLFTLKMTKFMSFGNGENTQKSLIFHLAAQLSKLTSSLCNRAYTEIKDEGKKKNQDFYAYREIEYGKNDSFWRIFTWKLLEKSQNSGVCDNNSEWRRVRAIFSLVNIF